MRRRGLWVLGLITGCHGGKVEGGEPRPEPEPAAVVAEVEVEETSEGEQLVPEATTDEQFTATLTIDAEPSGKRFQGVWLERSDGGRFVVDYRPRDIWQPFAGKRVIVTGERFEPKGQRISAQHFSITTLRLENEGDADRLLAVGPERSLVGKFAELHGQPGSKSEGTRWLIFQTTAGETFELANTPPDETVGEEFRLLAREVEMSRFAAHRPGRHLWVSSVVPTATDP